MSKLQGGWTVLVIFIAITVAWRWWCGIARDAQPAAEPNQPVAFSEPDDAGNVKILCKNGTELTIRGMSCQGRIVDVDAVDAVKIQLRLWDGRMFRCKWEQITFNGHAWVPVGRHPGGDDDTLPACRDGDTDG